MEFLGDSKFNAFLVYILLNRHQKFAYPSFLTPVFVRGRPLLVCVGQLSLFKKYINKFLTILIKNNL